MKRIHTITISLFAHEDEQLERRQIEDSIRSFVPFNLEKEKTPIVHQKVAGSTEKKIETFEVVLNKDRQTNALVDYLKKTMSAADQKLLLDQIESRIDSECNFFIRFDKAAFLENKLVLTDSGKCLHLKFSVAAFPKNRESAKTVIQEIFTSSADESDTAAK